MTYEQVLHDYANGRMVDYSLLELHEALSIAKKRVWHYEELNRTMIDEEASDCDRAIGIVQVLTSIHNHYLLTQSFTER